MKEVGEMNSSLAAANTAADRQGARASNIIAAVLSSFIPGLGQVYKGHVAEGLLWIFVGMPLAVWMGILLSLATAGIGLVLPLVCWVALAVDAYYEVDRRRHHRFSEPTIYDDID
jgi:TM2 domain-containing membrane protein YozV